MGDEKYYTIQIKGTAYRFKPIPSEDYERVALVSSLSVESTKVIKAVTRLLLKSAGEEAWDKLTDLYIGGELTIQELTTDVLSKLVERQQADEKKAKTVKGRGAKTAPANDAE